MYIVHTNANMYMKIIGSIVLTNHKSGYDSIIIIIIIILAYPVSRNACSRLKFYKFDNSFLVIFAIYFGRKICCVRHYTYNSPQSFKSCITDYYSGAVPVRILFNILRYKV